MQQVYKDIDNVSQEFDNCSKFLIAIGDETRQHMLIEMMKMRKFQGVRVGEITEKTNLYLGLLYHTI